MKIRYLSDIHLEFIKPNKLEKFIKKIPIHVDSIDEICILAGDIGNPYTANYDIFMKFISKNFKKSFVIAGNHEYYNKKKTIIETTNFLNEYFNNFDNITFLNNSYEYYENYCFIGTTLWSNITDLSCEINDVNAIPNFNYIKYNELNKICVNFLEETLQNNDTHCVIITHHVPSYSLINDKYKTSEMINYNQWFYCDMDKFIETHKKKIKCWIYGHTHTPSNIIINEIPFLCNPIGYPNENVNLNFQTTITI
jgi:predicted phosphohydrolase